MTNITSGNKITPAVIVINGNYISNDYRSGFKVGATSFTLKVADYFIKRDLLSGFIPYGFQDASRRQGSESPGA
ncbi:MULTISPECIES: hypothetical protein [Photorhabdus]|uniref:hypothetical protein n=1 Tax=Photorhabdus TaxID=29487 RepID=UPI0018655F32|nr:MULTISPECIES: hypothetical protein [Photorhabdus]MCT8343195.1 hypothetical protein [Photorhabdus kleinii]